jgi:hypothetical protein
MGGWREAPAPAPAPGGGSGAAALLSPQRSRAAAWRDALQPLRDAAGRRPPAPPGASSCRVQRAAARARLRPCDAQR